MGEPAGWEVYFEFQPVGSSMRVTAIDSVTATEVVVIGPVTAARGDLQKLALRKLKARLARDQGGTS